MQWSLGLLLLVLAGMAVYGYFIGTQIILAQAEAFAFRRMTVPQLAEQGNFRFFYANNRTPANLNGELAERLMLSPLPLSPAQARCLQAIRVYRRRNS